jgi:hypothetical protein
MIYKCENCINDAGCLEHKKQYKALCKAVEKQLKHDRVGGKHHCWFSLKLKCDYYESNAYDDAMQGTAIYTKEGGLNQ